MKEIFIIAVFIQILEFLKKSAHGHVWKIKIKSGKMVGNLAFFQVVLSQQRTSNQLLV